MEDVLTAALNRLQQISSIVTRESRLGKGWLAEGGRLKASTVPQEDEVKSFQPVKKKKNQFPSCFAYFILVAVRSLLHCSSGYAACDLSAKPLR